MFHGGGMLVFQVDLDLGRDVAGAGRGQLVGVDEETLVRVARVEGEHAMVDVLLQALAVVARSQGAASGAGEQAALDPLGLGVGRPGLSLNDDAPFAFGVLGAEGADVADVGRADEAFTADPVALVELVAVVEGVVESLLLFLGDSIDQIIGRLVGDVGVLLQDQRVVLDGVLFKKRRSHG